MAGNTRFYAFEKAAAPPAQARREDKASRTGLGALVRYNLHWTTLLYGVAGYFLAVASVLELLFPFGVAWFAAVASADKRRLPLQVLPVAAGYIFGGGQGLIAYGTALLLLAIFFTVYPPTRKKPRFILPVIVFSIFIVTRGLFLVFTGITDILLLAVFGESILAAVLSYFFYQAIQSVRRFPRADRLKREEVLCIFVLCVSVILGLESVALYGVSLADVAIRFLILAGALLGGVGGGASLGAACGLIPSLAAVVSPSSVGIFAFSGLVAGVFQHFGRVGVALGFLLGNLLLSFYLIDSALLYGSAVASLLAAAVLLLLPRGVLFRLKELFGTVLAVPPRAAQTQKYDDYVSSRLADVGEKLQSLRTVLRAIDREKQPPEDKNIQSILRHISGKVCADCSLRELCWEKDFYQTYRDVMVMFAAVESRGTVSVRDVPKSFVKRCSHYKEMVATINCLFEMYRKSDYWQRQVAGSRVLALGQLENTVHLLTRIGGSIDAFRDFREMASTRLAPSLRSKGLQVEQVFVRDVGERFFDLDLRVRRCRGGGDCGLVVANTVRELAGKEFYPAEVCCGDPKKGKLCRCRFFLSGAGDVVTASLQLPRDGSAACGDSRDDFLLTEARHAFVISDGMGSGERARREADLTVSLVRDVLQCGFDERFAATVVNYILLMKQEEEIFATVDLCIIDHCNQEAEFIKLGAPSSYLCGRNGVRVVYGNSLPLGVGDSGEVITFRERVQKGDLIVMVSDGVLHAGDDSGEMDVWLQRTIEDSRKEEPRIVAERIISGAVAFAGGKPRDDLTAMVTLVR